MPIQQGFLQRVEVIRSRIGDRSYLREIPSLRNLSTLCLDPGVTFFVGENGSGKSTLIEAIAIAAGFNPEGGSKSFQFAGRRSESDLHEAIRLHRGYRREKTGFFLRAESMFNLATEIERLDSIPAATRFEQVPCVNETGFLGLAASPPTSRCSPRGHRAS
jgi:predicted ATPase